MTAIDDEQYQNRDQKYNHQKPAQHHAVTKETKLSWDLYQLLLALSLAFHKTNHIKLSEAYKSHNTIRYKKITKI
jgi:hypothetical protein